MLERGRQPNIALFDFMELEFVGNVERIKQESSKNQASVISTFCVDVFVDRCHSLKMPNMCFGRAWQ